MRQNQCIVYFVVASIVWLALINFYLSFYSTNNRYAFDRLSNDLRNLEKTLTSQKAESDQILNDVRAIVQQQRGRLRNGDLAKSDTQQQQKPQQQPHPVATNGAELSPPLPQQQHSAQVAQSSPVGPPSQEQQQQQPQQQQQQQQQPPPPPPPPPSYPHIERDTDAIAVLLFACNRITVSRSLDQLIKYRPSALRFPIIVSQDCVHEPTTDVIRSYRDQVHLVRQPDQSDIRVPPKEKKFKGYFKIARHYKWALDLAFDHYGFETVVVIEDDLDVSPDFYEYFAATLPVLCRDPTLWCVSAWNDNGKPELVDKNAADLLYRTDFFPGLGWMLTNALWRELTVKWPHSYWDDWMREPAQRRNRSCIRPEVSRTRTFGKIGVSNGMFYDKHLKYIYLNEKFVEFTAKDLSYLRKEVYDPNFLQVVHDSPLVSHQELKNGRVFAAGSVRIQYDGKQTLKKIAKSLGLMDDFKSGVPRTAYKGVISFAYAKRRVFLTPLEPFTGYEPN